MIEIHTKKHIDLFLEKKKNRKKNLASQMYKDIIEVKRLDNHIKEFSKTLDKDIKKHDNREVFKYAQNFEKMIHQELDQLFKITEEDIELYLSILKSLNEYKIKIYKLTGSSKFGLTDIEMKYVKINIDMIKEKLKGLKKIFKELK